VFLYEGESRALPSLCRRHAHDGDGAMMIENSVLASRHRVCLAYALLYRVQSIHSAVRLLVFEVINVL
jgi:hypothetical protein